MTIPEAISERGRGGFPKENWGAVTWKGELDAVWAETTDICVSLDMLSEQTTRKIPASEKSWFGGSSLRHVNGKLSLVFSNSEGLFTMLAGVRGTTGHGAQFQWRNQLSHMAGGFSHWPGRKH